MILTCPKCRARFLLSAHVLGEEGKTVKCSCCSQRWFQEPDEEALAELRATQAEEDAVVEVDPGSVVDETPSDDSPSFDEVLDSVSAMAVEVEEDSEVSAEEEEEEDDEEGQAFDESSQETALDDDIPDSIKPTQDDGPELDFVDILPEPTVNPDSSGKHGVLMFFFEPIPFKQAVGGYVSAALWVFAVFFVLFSYQSTIVKASPMMVGFYNVFGVESHIEGQDLIFDSVSAQIESDKMKVKGQILNLKDRDQHLPQIVASVQNDADEVLARWVLKLPNETIPAGKILPFAAEYEARNFEGGESFVIEFIMDGADLAHTILSAPIIGGGEDLPEEPSMPVVHDTSQDIQEGDTH